MNMISSFISILVLVIGFDKKKSEPESPSPHYSYNTRHEEEQKLIPGLDFYTGSKYTYTVIVDPHISGHIHSQANLRYNWV